MKPTVVVVDDEPAIVEVVCDVLDEMDVDPIACTSGAAAVSCIIETQPHAVILDVQMPEVDGIEVFRRMRDNPATSSTPVIFFTANADKLRQRLPDYDERGAELLPKPFHVDTLLDLVQKVLEA
jgi:CheY-like chemotaxis protein